MLYATRAYGPDPRLRSGSGFAKGDDRTPAVNRSQVSRWESGASAVSFSVARRYEELCATPEGQVVAAVELLASHAPAVSSPAGPAAELRRPLVGDAVAETQDLVERALEGEPLGGVQWDRLSWLLSTLPASLLRRRDWQELTRRGLIEMNVMIGLAYEQRSVAMDRIAAHPRAGSAVTDVVGQILGDPGAQVYSESAALLACVPEIPEVAALLLRVAADPVNDNALRAALFVAATLVREGRMPNEPAQALVRIAYARCRDETQTYLVRRAAATLLVAVPAPIRLQMAAQLSSARPAVDFTSILADEGALDPVSQRRIIRWVEAHLAGVFGPSIHDDAILHEVLRRLARESNDEHRSQILELLMLLPLGRHVGDAYLDVLRTALAEGDRRLAHEALSVLLCLTPGDNLDLVTDLATGRGVEPSLAAELAVEASWAVGNSHFVHPRHDPAAAPLAEAVDAALAGRRSASPEMMRGWAYALGMRGHTALLDALVVPPDGPGDQAVRAAWESARSWWTGLPSYVAPGTCPDRHLFDLV